MSDRLGTPVGTPVGTHVVGLIITSELLMLLFALVQWVVMLCR